MAREHSHKWRTGRVLKLMLIYNFLMQNNIFFTKQKFSFITLALILTKLFTSIKGAQTEIEEYNFHHKYYLAYFYGHVHFNGNSTLELDPRNNLNDFIPPCPKNTPKQVLINHIQEDQLYTLNLPSFSRAY